MCENSGLVQPHFNHPVQFLAPQYKKEMQLLGSIQKRAVKMVKDLKKISDEQLKVFCLLSPELRGGLMAYRERRDSAELRSLYQ